MIREQNNPELELPAYFEDLLSKIEAAWCEDRDWSAVVHLASANPDVADALYDFFETLVESDYERLLNLDAQQSHTGVNITAQDISDWYSRSGKSIGEQMRIATSVS